MSFTYDAEATLFDSHCHFDFSVFGTAQPAIWQFCQQQHINRLLIPGTSPQQWPQGQHLSETLKGVYFSCGVHPWFLSEVPPDLPAAMSPYLQHKNCVAIGECGLDGSIKTDLAMQIPIFEAQLQLAKSSQLPLIVHAHKAHNKVQQLLKKYAPNKGGVIHAFTGSIELAQSYTNLGFKLGIGGSITYPRAHKTRRAAANLPLQSFLLETDAPDMPLHGHQGKANSPERLIDIARCLYELRRDAGKTETLDEIMRQTTDNSRSLFNV